MGTTNRAIKNITRRKTRSLLVIIALSLSMALMISIPAGLSANENATQKITNEYIQSSQRTEAELNKTTTLIEVTNQTSDSITLSGGGSVPQLPFIDKDVYNQILGLPNVKDVLPFFECSSKETIPTTINLGGMNMTMQKPAYRILGVPLDEFLTSKYQILPENITSGRNFQENDRNVVIISEDLIDYFHANVGDTITINTKAFLIIGIFGSSGGSALAKVYMNIFDAQEICDQTGRYSRIDVYVNDASNVDAISEVIQTFDSNIHIISYKDRLASIESVRQSQQQILNNVQATLQQTQVTARQEIIIIVVATSILVFFVMLYTVRERTKEIGTLKAIGFSNGAVMHQFIIEGVLLSSVAGVIGICIGFFVAPILSGLLLPYINPLSSSSSGGLTFVSTLQTTTPITVALSPELIGLSMGASLLLGALGSLYPAWKAAKIRPAMAMKYE
ncbi:MAG: ABC transporter permease [Candidatus Bathyarchaeia archaeon]